MVVNPYLFFECINIVLLNDQETSLQGLAVGKIALMEEACICWESYINLLGGKKVT